MARADPRRARTTLDHAQAAALDRLQQLWPTSSTAFRAARQSTLKKLFAPPDVPRGVYLWGGVGRGKSFLMDGFFATVADPPQDARALPRFMRDVHAELADAEARGGPARRRRGAASRAAGGSSASTNSTSPTSPTR